MNNFYIDKTTGYRVLTESFLRARGVCCGNGCKHCPYQPKHTKGTKELNNNDKH